MQALILAAGRGSRLGEKQGGTAKPLLDVGRKALIEHQVEALSGCGVGPVGMVVGYAAHEVEERVGIKAEYIRNTRWSVTNSLYSFWLARDWVKGDVVVLNCDVLFAPQILERLLDAHGDALVYDSTSGERREEMSVHVVDGMLQDMSKTLPVEKVSGENVGILRFTHETARLLFAKADELIAAGHERDWLGSAVREIARVRPIKAIDIHGLPWAEIDFPADLERARKVVLPAIEKMQRRTRTHALRRVVRWAALAVLLGALAFASNRAWIAPNQGVWESMPVSGPKPVTITDGTRHRSWWLAADGESATFTAEGPTTLRIDARPVFALGATSDAHFVVKVFLDGKEVGWHSASSKPSLKWNLDGRAIGKRFRTVLDVPQGVHEVKATVSASDMEGCLFRFAQLDLDT